ncbi:MAG: hypothetical protein R2815_10360 [Flavobacteriales bacterium]
MLIAEIREQGGTRWTFVVILLAALALVLVFFNILDMGRQFQWTSTVPG